MSIWPFRSLHFVCPARAGVNRGNGCFFRPGAPPAPHARGSTRDPDRLGTSTPHARGSTVLAPRDRLGSVVCPARAGINPRRMGPHAWRDRLPRTRGGQPGYKPSVRLSSAPHARGSTVDRRWGLAPVSVSAPRPRGSTRDRHPEPGTGKGFPARAGVNRARSSIRSWPGPAPHSRGSPSARGNEPVPPTAWAASSGSHPAPSHRRRAPRAGRRRTTAPRSPTGRPTSTATYRRAATTSPDPPRRSLRGGVHSASAPPSSAPAARTSGA